MNRKIKLSLQTSIILLIVCLTVPLSGIIISITYISSSDAVERLTDNLIHGISLQSMDKSLNYLKPARRGLELSRGLAKANILRGDQLDEIEQYFLHEVLIQVFHQF